MKHTSLTLFCAIEPKPLLQDDPPPGFREMVVKFKWPENVTLAVLERFRQRYARQYRLNECTMIVNSIIHGSFIVTWFVPASLIDTLIQRKDEDLPKELKVMRLTLDGNCIYESHMDEISTRYTKRDKPHFKGISKSRGGSRNFARGELK